MLRLVTFLPKAREAEDREPGYGLMSETVAVHVYISLASSAKLAEGEMSKLKFCVV